MVEHSEADENRCLEKMKEFKIIDFSFLVDSFCSAANRRGVFLPWLQVNPPRLVTLADLNEFFSNDMNIKEYEGLYNTLNYIKNRIYSVKNELIFEDYDEKKKVCELRLGEISCYIKSIKDGTKLKLSICDTGLTRSANGNYAYIHPYQQRMIDAVAFGTSLERLENGNYEDCKRLLFLPRNIKTNR